MDEVELEAVYCFLFLDDSTTDRDHHRAIDRFRGMKDMQSELLSPPVIATKEKSKYQKHHPVSHYPHFHSASG